MNRNLHHLSALTILAASMLAASAFAATPGNDPAALGQIRNAALKSDWAYERLADMTDLIGPRLSGSAGAAAAVTQVAEAMRKIGATVTLQPVKVPHWVRGAESAELVEYAGPSGRAVAARGADRAGRLRRDAGGRHHRAGDRDSRLRRTESARRRGQGPHRAVRRRLRPADGRARPGRPGLRPGRAVPRHGHPPGSADGRRSGAGALGRRRRFPLAAHRRQRPAGRRAHSGGGRFGRGLDADGAPRQARRAEHAPDPDAADPAGRRQLQRHRRPAGQRAARGNRDRLRPPRFVGPGDRRQRRRRRHRQRDGGDRHAEKARTTGRAARSA